MGGQAHFFVLALLCVACTALLRLYMPNFQVCRHALDALQNYAYDGLRVPQGDIFDHVINGTIACRHYAPNATRPDFAGTCQEATNSFTAEVRTRSTFYSTTHRRTCRRTYLLRCSSTSAAQWRSGCSAVSRLYRSCSSRATSPSRRDSAPSAPSSSRRAHSSSFSTTTKKPYAAQDIAFFDGMRVGDLMQRMSGDVTRMLAPISNSLSSILQVK